MVAEVLGSSKLLLAFKNPGLMWVGDHMALDLQILLITLDAKGLSINGSFIEPIYGRWRFHTGDSRIWAAEGL